MKRSTAAAYFGIATLLLTAVGTQSGYASPLPHRQESVFQQNIPSFEINQGDARQAVRTLFKKTNLAYTIAPDVQGTITISLKNVPFEIALQNVLRQVDATYRMEGGVVNIVRLVAEPWVDSVPAPTSVEVAPPRPPAAPKESPSIVQDGAFLYIVRGNSMYKVRKSDMKVVASGRLPG